MDFDACVELLKARPSHAHHCESDIAEQPVANIEQDKEHAAAAFAQLQPAALATAFFRLQEARAGVYAAFRTGFEEHQQTPRFAAFSGGITARFAALSNQINGVERALIEKKHERLAQYVRKVQLEEKEKLLVTSALLVEKMRLKDALSRPEPDATTTALLEQSVDVLGAKHTAVVQRINDLLDELRADAMDLDDDATAAEA
ncbi:hypothetical protein PybrP1_008035 [[Pythium] brassicae (nom. inval.)]|nr:hypothetical protein PybrP1_008035 [[Pythium] brassicae (nom. inval.)]